MVTRATRSKVAPAVLATKDISSRNGSSRAPVKELVVKKQHPPDMAAGGCFGMGMSAVPYCQEINPASTRKSVDPPDANEVRFKQRRSAFRDASHLEPVEENSYEGTASRSKRSADSPERNNSSKARPSKKNTSIPKKIYSNKMNDCSTRILLNKVGHDEKQRQVASRARCDSPELNPSRHQVSKDVSPELYSNYQLDSIGVQQYQERVKVEVQALHCTAKVQSSCNFGVSELTFRGLILRTSTPPE